MCRCDEALELISMELDETLTPEQHARLQEHIAACGHCRTLALDLRELHEAMPDLTVPVPAGFADSVMEKIRQERGKPSMPAKRDWKRNWRVWGGLAAALVLIAVGTGHLPMLGMGAASSGSTAAAMPVPAPAVLTGSAESTAGDETYGSANTEGGEAVTDVQRSFSITGQAPEASAPLTKSTLISGYGADTDSGTVLTAEDAGYRVLEAAAAESITQYESMAEGETSAFIAETEDGVTYHLTYTGMSEDGSRYEFTLRAGDDTEQIWSVRTDGSEVMQVQ